MCLACQQFSHIYRPRPGLIISYPLRDSIAEILRNRPNREVGVIVVTVGLDIQGNRQSSRRMNPADQRIE